MRGTGGRLKMGHGPGGPPVLGTKRFLALLGRLIALGVISRADVEKALDEGSATEIEEQSASPRRSGASRTAPSVPL
jgi:hypothetical protein